ncbi:hypothetical protein ASPWEDRAFT_691752 [Aspergillus wentii DTO 134E9]|uniref:Zn(2)-C6 fungal-type domain-containing protein n=1 Tax=Aspergillus wentii DTO 134E9 TaxID=1073089 RepID=A0A1L9R928_ASPWE|nr:uncharacterized protein ASPWEDRAFT_691752 [Aspergillus wentii DTO 134E9]OJJ31431.1 hypothetical protein ASPWEDRAFT_691752 [Aspergillus wentii DTO 134E9]
MPPLGIMESPDQRRMSNRTQSRHVNAIRRSTNACQRCKRRKIKCHYNSDNSHHKCVACSRSYSGNHQLLWFETYRLLTLKNVYLMPLLMAC